MAKVLDESFGIERGVHRVIPANTAVLAPVDVIDIVYATCAGAPNAVAAVELGANLFDVVLRLRGRHQLRGNELVGSLWVMLLSIAALRSNGLGKALSFYGILVAVAGIVTIIPGFIDTSIFGLGMIVCDAVLRRFISAGFTDIYLK